ncbi:MAG: hypothetical protein LBH19_06710 [Dysgonamonadaceae bacterium]|jgi:hypothetical protein|nr:hypothetical protein [Dysgonamonadaceae bacterium]
MKLTFYTLLFFFLPVYLHGQEEKPVATYGTLELTRTQSLWFGSSNAAGMAITPLHDYNLLEAQYDYTFGDYKQQQSGDKERKAGVNVDGALRLGKFFLWGNFLFSDSYVTGSKYNANRYEQQSDMPYYVADTVLSDWKKQSYDMTCKAAFPLSNRLILGGEIHYSARKAAKQMDPRSVLYCYAIEVKPALVFGIADNCHAGLNFLYQNAFDRNTFTNSLQYSSERVYMMKGLGNYSVGVVGGVGAISPFYYLIDRYGGGLQYDIAGDFGRLLAEVTYTRQRTDAFEDPAKPRRRGAAQKTEYDGKIQRLKSGTLTHKLVVQATLSATNGIEYLQEYNGDYNVNQWITIAEYVKSTYKQQRLSLAYDLYSGALSDYSWKAGINAAYNNRQDEYISPQAVFNTENVYTELLAAKRFIIGSTSTLHAELNVGYHLNIGGEYLYNGPEPSSVIIRDFFAKDSNYFTAHYLQTGCNLYWSLALKSKSSVNFRLNGQWIKPDQTMAGDRHFASIAIGYIF